MLIIYRGEGWPRSVRAIRRFDFIAGDGKSRAGKAQEEQGEAVAAR